MSDETTLLPCPFCGGEARHYAPGPIDHHIECVECYADIHRATEAEAIAAWNTRADYHGYEQAAIEAWENIKAWNARATNGTLTAEQVREAVMSADRWEKPMGNTGLTNTHLIIRDDGWQAIADELNAELGSRTCELVETASYSNPREVIHLLECSECGRTCEHVNGSYPRCPHCGAKAVER